MMDLKIQIFSFIFSFFYGIFLFYMFKISHRLLFIKKKILKFIYNFCFCMLLSFSFFYIIYYLNGGIVHLYFILLILFGFLLTYRFTKK